LLQSLFHGLFCQGLQFIPALKNLLQLLFCFFQLGQGIGNDVLIFFVEARGADLLV